jgi:DNA-directed RNA polymerase specialized sigma subunit
VVITPEVDPQTLHEIEDARHAVQLAEGAQRVAAKKWRQVARTLKAHGLANADIAKVLKVSKQRVSQLIK